MASYEEQMAIFQKREERKLRREAKAQKKAEKAKKDALSTTRSENMRLMQVDAQRTREGVLDRDCESKSCRRNKPATHLLVHYKTLPSDATQEDKTRALMGEQEIDSSTKRVVQGMAELCEDCAARVHARMSRDSHEVGVFPLDNKNTKNFLAQQWWSGNKGFTVPEEEHPHDTLIRGAAVKAYSRTGSMGMTAPNIDPKKPSWDITVSYPKQEFAVTGSEEAPKPDPSMTVVKGGQERSVDYTLDPNPAVAPDSLSTEHGSVLDSAEWLHFLSSPASRPPNDEETDEHHYIPNYIPTVFPREEFTTQQLDTLHDQLMRRNIRAVKQRRSNVERAAILRDSLNELKDLQNPNTPRIRGGQLIAGKDFDDRGYRERSTRANQVIAPMEDQPASTSLNSLGHRLHAHVAQLNEHIQKIADKESGIEVSFEHPDINMRRSYSFIYRKGKPSSNPNRLGGVPPWSEERKNREQTYVCMHEGAKGNNCNTLVYGHEILDHVNKHEINEATQKEKFEAKTRAKETGVSQPIPVPEEQQQAGVTAYILSPEEARERMARSKRFHTSPLFQGSVGNTSEIRAQQQTSRAYGLSEDDRNRYGLD